MFVLVLGRSKSGFARSDRRESVERIISGGYGGGDIPVPIPNTAVKPTSADGTWGFLPGRVGRRRDFLKAPHCVGGFHIPPLRPTGLWRARTARQSPRDDHCQSTVGSRRPDDAVTRGEVLGDRFENCNKTWAYFD